MLDIKLIREQPDFVRQRLATRNAGDEARIDDVLKFDEQRRKILAEVEALKAQRNRVSKEIGALMGQKKLEDNWTRMPPPPSNHAMKFFYVFQTFHINPLQWARAQKTILKFALGEPRELLASNPSHISSFVRV
jgi:hypothetical protein